jgi:hypothetical protein
MLRNEAYLPMVAALLLTLSGCGPARRRTRKRPNHGEW